jgi:hypothetical protein
MQPVSKQRFGKHVSAATDTNATIGERCFLFGSCEVVIKKSSAENRQSSSGVPSEQLVEIWALQEWPRRWRYEFRCGVLPSERRRDYRS